MTKPQNTYKHLVKFTSKQASRPALLGVHVTPDGTIEATDAHILIRLPNRLPASENRDIIIDPKSLSTYDERYPELDRLVPDSSTKAKISLNLSVKQAETIFNFLKIAKKDQIAELVFQKDPDILEVRIIEINESSLIKIDYSGDFTETVIHCGTGYLKTVMEAIKDLTETYSEVSIYDKHRPIFFKEADNYDILLTPMRLGPDSLDEKGRVINDEN